MSSSFAIDRSELRTLLGFSFSSAPGSETDQIHADWAFLTRS